MPGRVAPGPDSRRLPRWGLLGSLALHLVPLVLLLDWSSQPAERSAPIPVTLVVEPPPPPPAAPPPQPAAKPPAGRLASEETGAPAEQPDDAAASDSAAAPAEQRQAAALVPPPKPPPPEPQALPTPDIPPPPQPRPPDAAAALRRPPAQARPRQRAPRAPGPAASRDEYLAHLAALTRPHLHLLPPSLIDGRRGSTTLAIRVLGDGTIARITVSRSSGYPEIDAGVVRMIAAVGRFPPLPQWIQQPGWDINFRLDFPW